MLILHLAMLVAPVVMLAPGVAARVKPFGRCLFRSLLGFDCPACGITHSVKALLRGDFVGSLLYHPGGLVIAVILVSLVVYFAVVLALGNRVVVGWRREAKVYRRVELAAVVVLFAGWVVRMLMD